MASIADDPKGRKRIQFIGRDGTRKAVRLGKVSTKQAEAFKIRVERLASAQILGHPPDDETCRWLAELPDAIHGRLAAAGLATPRESLLLGEWIEKYLRGRGDLRPASLTKLRQTRGKLLAHFDAATPLRGITPAHAG